MIVLLPGMDGTGELFQPFISALGGEFDVQIVRYPTDGALGYEDLESIVRESLPQDAPFVILGESFSGPIAVSIAASGTQGLAGVVMSSSFIRNPRPLFSSLSAMVSIMPVKRVPTEAMSYFLTGNHATPELRAALRSSLATVSAVALQARMKAVLSVDVSVELSAVRVPVLYLRGAEDRVVPASAATQLTTMLPAARVVAFAAPHFLLQVVPALAAAEVGAFVRQVTVGK